MSGGDTSRGDYTWRGGYTRGYTWPACGAGPITASLRRRGAGDAAATNTFIPDRQ